MKSLAGAPALPRLRILLSVLVLALALPSASSHAEDSEPGTEDALPDHASPSACVVIIKLAIQSAAITGSDVEVYENAEKVFRKKSIELNEGIDGSNQMIGSSVAFFDKLGPDQLASGAEMCLAAVEEDFEADE